VYTIINTFRETVIGSISPQYVKQYEWIRENVAQGIRHGIGSKYRDFWRMNMSRLGEDLLHDVISG
jgi:hypothetical protein